MAMVPFRASWPTIDIVLVLAAVEILAAISGSGLASAAAIVSAAVTFDVFFLRPYGDIAIHTTSDAVAIGLLVAVGAAVTMRVGIMRSSITHRATRVAELEVTARALRREAARFHAMLEATPDAIVGVDRAGVIRLSNNKASELFGYPRTELDGMPAARLMPESARAIHAALRADRRADPGPPGGTPGQDPVALRKDGTQFPAEVLLATIDVDGGPLVLADVRDVTERRVAEAMTRRLASAVQYAGEAIVTRSPDGIVLSWNLGAEQLYGYSAEEIVGRPISSLIAPGHQQEAAELTADVLATCQQRRSETIARRKDGTLVEVMIGLSPIADGMGEVAEILSISSDISARKRNEEALRERTRELEASNRELAEFAYIASHDLREPLRKISSFCQLLADGYQGRLDEKANQYIAFIVDGAERMQQLIEDVLAFSRSGRSAGKTSEVDCAAIVRLVTRDLAAMIEETGACITVAGSLPVVRAEPALLTQVFENLVSNAIKFRGSDPPRVTISAAREKNAWRFAVADNGIGIDPAYADRVFAIFQRLHSRAEYPGSGIGLAICKKIVEAYGGRIWFDSQSAAGTTFYWTFPIGTGRHEVKAAGDPRRDLARRRRPGRHHAHPGGAEGRRGHG